MKLTVFRSSKGDCLLISNNDAGTNKHILIDGGMTGSFRDYVEPYLNKNIQQQNEKIDLLCVSHIDEDHIKGILYLLEHLADWRAKKYHHSQGNNNFKPRLKNEPPDILNIWHNSFADTYEMPELAPQIQHALTQVQQLTFRSEDETLQEANNKATSIQQGITLSQLIHADQLNIDLNEQYNGRIVKCNKSTITKNTHVVAGANVTIIGPFAAELKKLKKDWIKWESNNQQKLEEFYADFKLAALEFPLSDQDLTSFLTMSGTLATFGDKKSVTIPNLASIMFLVESPQGSILMTGDGHSDDIIEGLKVNKKLDDQGAIHIDILKIQHHGAEANIDKEFCEKVLATHYVFCGNGTHHNPEIGVVELIHEHRPKGTAFTFWFNVNPKDKLTVNQKKHITALGTKLKQLKDNDASGLFNYKFIPLNKGHFEIVL